MSLRTARVSAQVAVADEVRARAFYEGWRGGSP